MATVRDVANEAQVSTATVSRVLNGRSDVDEEMARRVGIAVEKLGYRPNPLGRALRKQRTDIWSVLVSDIENPFFTAVIRGLEEVALANGKSVWLCNTGEDVEREQTYIRTALEHQVSGVVVASASAARSDLGPLLDADIPVVLVDRIADLHPELDSVLVDNEEGARSVTHHLVGQGYNRVGCIAGPDDVSTAEQRILGYLTALRELGRSSDTSWIARDDYTREGGRRAAERLFALEKPPDAVLVANARMAIGVLEAAREHELMIGRDLALATFDDEPWTSLVTPSITVVRQPTHELGRLAAEALLRPRDQASETVHACLPCELLIRASTPPVD